MAKKIGPYEIVSELGRGGMGVVYKAREESLQRYVAIKMLGNQLVDDEAVAERFLREARVVADLNHPNLVQVFRVDRHEDQPYFAMEFVEGDSLKALIQRERQLQPLRALQILQEVANGLAAAHDKGVVHRDIKPENIMLTKYGGVKVVDFGIARDENADTRLTTTGIGLGTPNYLSPEVCLSQEVDQRSDIFSLGVVLYEMLTGDTPFRSDSPFEMMTKVVEAKIPDIKDVNPNVDEGIKKILAKMIAKRPKKRYQHCNELISDIEDYRAGREPRWAKDVVLEDMVESTGPQAPKAAAAGTDAPTLAATTPVATASKDSPPTVRVAPPTSRTEAIEPRSGNGRGLAVAALFVLLLVSGAAASTWYLLAGSERPLVSWFGDEDAAEGESSEPAASSASLAGLDASASGEAAPVDAPAVASTASASIASTSTNVPTNTPTAGATEEPTLAANTAGSDKAPSSMSMDAPVELAAASNTGAGFQFDVQPASGPEPMPVDKAVAQVDKTAATVSAGNGSTAGGVRPAGAQDAIEASEQPPANLDAPALDTEQAVARIERAPVEPPAPSWDPSAPRVVVVAAGDPAVAEPIEQSLEQALNRASFELMDEDLVDGMAYAETLPDIVRAARDAGADILVFADVVPTGERQLQFYGRTDYQYLANLQVRVVVLHERRNLGPIVRESLEYVALTADQKAREASRTVARDVVTRLRALRAGATTAQG